MTKTNVDKEWLDRVLDLAELGESVLLLVDESLESLRESPEQIEQLVAGWLKNLRHPPVPLETKPRRRRQPVNGYINVDDGVEQVRHLKHAFRRGEISVRIWAGQLARITRQIAAEDRDVYKQRIAEL